MLTEKIKKALKANWGERADALDCYVEARIVDPLSSWTCYLYAMDSEEEIVNCILISDGLDVEIEQMPWRYIQWMFNEAGECPIVDQTFRRIKVDKLLEKLRNERT